MTQQMIKKFGRVTALMGAALIASIALAQGPATGKKLPIARRGNPNAQTDADKAATSDSPAYTFTLISYPGTLNTLGVGINPDAFNWGNPEKPSVEIVGAWFFPDDLSQTGFRARASENKAEPGKYNESYYLLNDPNAPTPQQAYSINDLGQVVGDYIDSSGIFHAYELDCDHFLPLDVPFAGATGTYSPAINNAGEIVGDWNDSAGNAHGFTLKAGKYASFDYPGAAQAQFYYAINSQGDIAGSYQDSSGNIHGFVRKGTTYTPLNFPGAIYTAASGINDDGVVVGGYCLTTRCFNTGEGELGFIWSKGTYTTFTIPGEFEVALASINNKGVLMGNYLDAAGLVYTFLAVPAKKTGSS